MHSNNKKRVQVNAQQLKLYNNTECAKIQTLLKIILQMQMQSKSYNKNTQI